MQREVARERPTTSKYAREREKKNEKVGGTDGAVRRGAAPPAQLRAGP